jgi:hypothetical protein
MDFLTLAAAQESTEEEAFSLLCSFFKSKQISSCQQSPTRLLLTFWNKSPSPSWEFKLPLNRFQIWASMTSQQPQTHGQPLLLTYPSVHSWQQKPQNLHGSFLKLFLPPYINLLVMHVPSPSVVTLLNPRHVRFFNNKKKKNPVSKNQGWEPIHQKYKANENTSRHNPKKTWT